MSILAHNQNLYDAISLVYNYAKNIYYKNIYFRRDIGFNHLILNNDNRKMKIAILGSTKGSSIQKLIDNIKNKKINASIEVIIANRKNAYILERAKQNSISCIYLPFKKSYTRYKYDEKIVNILRAYDVDLVFLVGYMKIVTKVLINEFKDRIFNIHPSLLPKYKGLMDLNVHELVIKNKDKYMGCTLHDVIEDLDNGKIVIQKQCKVNSDNVAIVKKRIQELESDAIIECINLYSQLPISYQSSGVNINNSDNFVNYIKNNTNIKTNQFSAKFKVKNIELSASTDGVGTKLDIAIMANKYDTIGIDLVAMSVNDLLVNGVKPLYFLDYLAFDKLNIEKSKEIINSIKLGCDIANCSLIGGETAEMKGIYKYGKFDMAGFALGEVIFNFNNSVEKGNIIYGIPSNGIHSNGYSLVRKLLKFSTYDLDELLTPTRIYNEIIDIYKFYAKEITGIVHVTGGGIRDNLKRILNNHDYELNNWKFPEIFNWIQKNSKLNKKEMLSTFNCGYGILLIMNKEININDYKNNISKCGIEKIGIIID